MDFRFTPEQEEFRRQIREFLQQELTPEFRASLEESGEGGFSKEFSRKLGEKGWIGLPWPKEYGGQALGYIERLIYGEEMVLNGAPVGYHHIAERQMGPSIIMFGTDEQKRWFPARIARGELGFAVGYSEPEAGSDLASLQTRAVEDGDDYVINGSKVWNSAHHSDWMWLAARTNPDAPKHRGISVFLLDLKTPGVIISPIMNMAGVHGFNLVTFDDARIPKELMVGEKDRGWYVVAGNLDFERAGIERVAGNYPLLKEFVQFIKETRYDGSILWEDPLIRHRVSEMHIELEVGRLMCYKIAWMQSQGIVPNMEASVSKVFGTEASQRIARGMMEILGLYGQLDKESRYVPLQGRILRAWYSAIPATIGGGTSEIQRNIIATRGLGLPRG